MFEWISVKDRLPEHKGDYLVYWELTPQRYWLSDGIEIVHFKNNKFFTKDKKNITHWMPLPEKPKNK